VDNNYLDFSLYNDVESRTLRAWNRSATAYNVLQEHGTQGSEGYIKSLSPDDVFDMQVMYNLIKKYGKDHVAQRVQTGTEFLGGTA